jgi:predicted nucleic acid-binding protein
MIKQIMDVTVLPQFIANKLGTSKVMVLENNNILTIEPFASNKPDFTSHNVGDDNPLQSISVDKTKAGALTLEDFTDLQISTKGFNLTRKKLMSVGKAFIDTNVFIYMYSKDEHEKRKLAFEQINKYDRFISTQILNEFCNVCIHKLKLELLYIEAATNKICRNNTLTSITFDTVKLALYIHGKYHFSYYDALMVASALETECDFLITEDLQNGQLIEEKLIVFNIFATIIS